jgi:hypothetical protein
MAFQLSSMAYCFPQRLSAFFNGFPIFLNGDFCQRLSAFLNGFPIFLNGFPLSEKSEKIYLRQQVYKRSLFELRISCHLLPELRKSRYNVNISPTHSCGAPVFPLSGSQQSSRP